MNTSRLLGIAAITVGIGGFGWYFLKGEGRTVIRGQAPGLQAPPPPGTILPSKPRLTRSKPVAPKVTEKMRNSAALPPMSAEVQRATARAERVRRRDERAARRQALAERYAR